MLKQLGPTEILLILGVLVLLVGGKKLPDLARGSGQALRIFRTEVKALDDGQDEPEVRADTVTVPEATLRAEDGR
nr:twin-arginine translocase TatA/TatE family subunit [Aeromicrobium sp.]